MVGYPVSTSINRPSQSGRGIDRAVDCVESFIRIGKLIRSLGMVEFDEIDNWAPELAAALSRHVPDSVAPQLTAAAPEFVEDARDLLFELTDRDAVIDATLDWIRSTEIVGYHGTRLTDEEIASVQANGLVPLKAEARRSRLVRALSSHPRWCEAADRLDDVIRAHGPGGGVLSYSNTTAKPLLPAV